MQSLALTQSLSFGLDINTGRPSDLQDGSLESRRIRNEVNRLDKQGWDWSEIETTVKNNANHVQNTTQLIVQKSLKELETYHKDKDDDWGSSVSVHRP